MGAIIEGDRLLHYRGDTEYVVSPGCLILIPPSIPYTNLGYSNQREFWLFFSPERSWSDLLEPCLKNPGLWWSKYQGTVNEQEMRECMSIIMNIHNRIMLDKNHWLNNIVERMLLLSRRADSNALPYRFDERIEKTIRFISENYQRDIPVEKLASIACMSLSRYAHLFKECTGMGPAAYLESIKLGKARDLLISTSLSIKEIAEAIGFCNPLYFSQRHHAKFGCSPTDFRRKNYR
ncbi:MAG TPA: helix-turn-helix domain-containing protein [Bacteroidales bacterium]|nr:helix-turn-helix domain-containing protein [Bacteroidales bacterium]